jgi:hypothetical protein
MKSLNYVKYLLPLILFVIIPPTTCAETTIATMNCYWYLTGDLTNTNPYTVFVSVPDNVSYSSKSLKAPDDFLKITLNDNDTPTYNTIVFYNTILNGKKGFWMPPYSTIKIHMGGIWNFSLTESDSQENYGVSGPGLVNELKVIDLQTLFPTYKQGVKFDNFKLYVHGSISKSPDTTTLSLIIPTPVALKGYYRFGKIVGDHDIDIWTDSYNEYIDKHEKIKYKQNPDIYDTDDALVPTMDDDLGNSNLKIKIFDVPAMVFTTSSYEPLDFKYAMYWDKNYN